MKYPFLFKRGMTAGTDTKVVVLVTDYTLEFLETWTPLCRYVGQGATTHCQYAAAHVLDPKRVELHEFDFEWEALAFIQKWWSEQPKIEGIIEDDDDPLGPTCPSSDDGRGWGPCNGA